MTHFLKRTSKDSWNGTKRTLMRLYRPWPVLVQIETTKKPRRSYIEIEQGINALNSEEAPKSLELNPRNFFSRKWLLNSLALIGILSVGGGPLILLKVSPYFDTQLNPKEIFWRSLIAVALVLFGAVLLRFRDKLVKMRNINSSFSVEHNSEYLENSISAIRSKSPHLYSKDNSNTILQISPNTTDIADGVPFVLGDYKQRCKLSLAGDIPNGPIFIERSVITSILADRAAPFLNINPGKFSNISLSGYLRDRDQLRSLVAIIQNIHLDESDPERPKLTRTRRKFLQAFMYIRTWRNMEFVA